MGDGVRADVAGDSGGNRGERRAGSGDVAGSYGGRNRDAVDIGGALAGQRGVVSDRDPAAGECAYRDGGVAGVGGGSAIARRSESVRGELKASFARRGKLKQAKACPTWWPRSLTIRSSVTIHIVKTFVALFLVATFSRADI